VNSNYDDPTKGRFEFGKNWSKFEKSITANRISEAEKSLQKLLQVESLEGKSFIDVGCGSGLFSLAARNLGAKVLSFDFDVFSVETTQLLKDKYYVNDENWTIEQGSVLDRQYINSLGHYDVVYSWGVLHHTGAMWLALENCISLLNANEPIFYTALYNDQGYKSRIWWLIKFSYSLMPKSLQAVYGLCLGYFFQILNILKYTIKLSPMTAIRPLLNYKKHRGMALNSDILDWIGGMPFEFVDYDLMIEYASVRGLKVINSQKVDSSGCHEFVFTPVFRENLVD
jgi:SAM-dependent methyltransferase